MLRGGDDNGLVAYNCSHGGDDRTMGVCQLTQFSECSWGCTVLSASYVFLYIDLCTNAAWHGDLTRCAKAPGNRK